LILAKKWITYNTHIWSRRLSNSLPNLTFSWCTRSDHFTQLIKLKWYIIIIIILYLQFLTLINNNIFKLTVKSCCVDRFSTYYNDVLFEHDRVQYSTLLETALSSYIVAISTNSINPHSYYCDDTNIIILLMFRLSSHSHCSSLPSCLVCTPNEGCPVTRCWSSSKRRTRIASGRWPTGARQCASKQKDFRFRWEKQHNLKIQKLYDLLYPHLSLCFPL